MHFIADLHIHSKYSRACSRDCDLEHLTWWARRKGITLVGTGDFTHPAWFEHLRENLVPAEPGLYRLRDDRDVPIRSRLPATCQGTVRFMLSVEISTIYKRDGHTRKVHHLVYVPDFESAEKVNRALGRIGNLGSDGRPILGLDSRDLLEITLDSGPGSYLVPAHVWTPWFSALGSKSGFDAVADCYADLADHIFAVETGLSSDPAMNWRVSSLDRYRLVSNSDAHSPPMLGREASAFATDLDYFAVRRALETGVGYEGSVEFFPEEGKYHLDGHRKCGVRLSPGETRARGGRCPGCGKPVTVGVLHRVEELADRPEGTRPEATAGFRNWVPLPEMLGEILGVGPKSKKVAGEFGRLVATLGPEFTILGDVPLPEIERAGSSLLAEAVARLRRGQVVREGGYDGEYGVVRIFEPGELVRTRGVPALFEMADEPVAATAEASRRSGPVARERAASDGDGPGPGQPRPVVATADNGQPEEKGREEGREEEEGAELAGGLLAGLDADQRLAAAADGPLLILAGPGTGKTRTLTRRIAHLVTERGVPPERCLAITFTRRAADEMAERLRALVPAQASRITVATFHGLGHRIVREHHERIGLGAGFGIADEAERLAIAREVAGDLARSERDARRLLDRLSLHRRVPSADPGLTETFARYEKALRARDRVDFDDLVTLPVALLEEHPGIAESYRERYSWISVDEYQDVDSLQYRLLRLLTRPDGDLAVIGDPDQAIYRFRGADVGFFLRFQQDFPAARTVTLTRNYRSSATIVRGALQAIAPASLVRDRVLRPERNDGPAARIGVFEAGDERAEGEFVARSVDRLLGGASFHSLDIGRADSDGAEGLSFADVAVLYRTDSQARPVMDALTRAGMPFQKRSHDRLSARPGVQEITREMSFEPIRAGSGDGVLSRVRGVVRTLVERLPAAEEERAAELHAAVDLLAPLAERCAEDTERFHAELALGAEVDTWDPRADRISLLTLHAAKGLEFPVVFLVGCEDGLLPLRWSGADDRGADVVDLDEERRLFFVGMTRAESYLFLTRARTRSRQGAVRRMDPSPFLAALEEALLDHAAGGPRSTRSRDRQLPLFQE